MQSQIIQQEHWAEQLALTVVKQEKLPVECVFPKEVLAIILLSVYPKSHLTDNTP